MFYFDEGDFPYSSHRISFRSHSLWWARPLELPYNYFTNGGNTALGTADLLNKEKEQFFFILSLSLGPRHRDCGSS